MLGIDFGTSNTAATLRWPDGRVRAVLFDGAPLLPSAVCVEGDAILVGHDALQAARANPAGAELHPKQRIDDGTVLLSGTEYPVTDLIGAVLRRVLQEATRTAGQPPARLVLAHPASWGAHRRETLLAAATAAGAPRCDLVVEPVAAAGHFVGAAADRLPVGARALIYDLGAGTFDASVVRRRTGGFEVLATEGLTGAGGLDIDAAIVAHLTAVYGGRDGGLWRRVVEPASDADRRLNRQMWDDVRLAKESLSRRTSARITLPLLDDDALLGREQLDALARPLLERTVTACRAALAAAGLSPADLASVFLVGGASRYPLVSTVLHQALGSTPTATEQPELAVAEGAVQPVAEPAGSVPGGLSAPSGGRPGRGFRVSRRITALTAGLAVVAIAAGMALAMRPDRDDRTAGSPQAGGNTVAPSTSASTAAAASVTPTPSAQAATGIDECLLGRWQEVSYSYPGLDFYGTSVNLSLAGKGSYQNFLPDGTAWTDYRNGMTKSGKVGGKTYQVIHKGTLFYTYQAVNDTLVFAPKSATGTTTWRVGGTVRASAPLTQDTGGGASGDYTCVGDVLRFVDDNYAQVFKRVGPAQSRPR